MRGRRRTMTPKPASVKVSRSDLAISQEKARGGEAGAFVMLRGILVGPCETNRILTAASPSFFSTSQLG